MSPVEAFVIISPLHAYLNLILSNLAVRRCDARSHHCTTLHFLTLTFHLSFISFLSLQDFAAVQGWMMPRQMDKISTQASDDDQAEGAQAGRGSGAARGGKKKRGSVFKDQIGPAGSGSAPAALAINEKEKRESMTVPLNNSNLASSAGTGQVRVGSFILKRLFL